MSISLKVGAKVSFIIGIAIIFVSLFMDWYSFRATDSEGYTVIQWSYYLLFDWHTTLSTVTYINDLYRPEYASVPLVIPVMMILSLAIGVYGAIIHDIERKSSFSSLKKYVYANFMILILNGFFLIGVPANYLIPNDLYYPFIHFNDVDLGVSFVYNIGIGYIMQIVSMVLIVPYVIFYYNTMRIFEKTRYSYETRMEKALENVKELVDMDRLITEEEMVLEQSKSKIRKRQAKHTKHTLKESEIDQIYHKFLESKGAK